MSARQPAVGRGDKGSVRSGTRHLVLQLPGERSRDATRSWWIFALALCLAPSHARAQTSLTCGWPSTDAQQVPPTLQALRSRAGPEVPDWLPKAEDQLLRWYRDCDATAGHSAAFSLRVLRDYTRSSDPLLLAWLGVAYVRGPEVQLLHADGTFLRSAHHFSNDERVGPRLLADVLARTGWTEVGEELAAVGLATRKDETLRLASEALGKATKAHDDSRLWSALAEVELARGDRGAAQRAAARAVAAGSPRGMRVMGILRMLEGRDTAGTQIYVKGLETARTEEDWQPFFDDLRLLLGPDELAQWQALDTGRAAWIERKWEWRAHMAGVQLAERLGVNERRFEDAMKRYTRLSFRVRPDSSPSGATPPARGDCPSMTGGSSSSGTVSRRRNSESRDQSDSQSEGSK